MRRTGANPWVRGTRTACVLIAVLLVVLIQAPTANFFPQQRPAVDLLLINARVITINASQPSAEAIAIRGDRITWTGTNAEARRLFPKASRIIDLHGATVLPGLIDAHVHLLSLGQSLLRLNLKDVADEQQAVELVRQ